MQVRLGEQIAHHADLLAEVGAKRRQQLIVDVEVLPGMAARHGQRVGGQIPGKPDQFKARKHTALPEQNEKSLQALALQFAA